MRWLLAAMAMIGVARAEAPASDANWPCAQALVPVLAAGAYWDGKVPEHTAWRDDDTLSTLVPEIVDRDTPDAEAAAKLRAYVETIPQADRAAKLPALFSAIVDQTNDMRSLLIARIEQLGLRQRRMGDVVARLSTEADETPATDRRHADLAGERDFDIRAFQETQHTMRYACEAPANMERRLGAFARELRTLLR